VGGFQLPKAGKSDSKGYLVCEECGGYYKLKKGESPSDFVSCECGGSLQHYDSLEEAYTEKLQKVDETTNRTSKEGEITLENLLEKDYDNAQNFISTVQDKREEIKTHRTSRGSNYILISIVIIIILLIILIF